MTTIAYAGGVVVHFKDGRREQVLYGERIDLDEVEEYQREELISRNLVDEIERTSEQEARNREQAGDDAVEEDGGRFAKVPSDYGSLDEKEAAGVVRAFRSDKKAQAQVVGYEQLHANRRFVIDQATPEAREAAQTLLVQVKGKTSYGPQDAAIPPPADTETVGVPPPAETE